jgi:hypothetical protein
VHQEQYKHQSQLIGANIMDKIFDSTQAIQTDRREDSFTSLFNASAKKKEEFSLHRAINRIAKEINEILDHGYSREDVAAILSSKDFKVGKNPKHRH